MSTRERERDLELLIPVATVSENGASKSSSGPVAALSNHHSGREVRLRFSFPIPNYFPHFFSDFLLCTILQFDLTMHEVLDAH